MGDQTKIEWAESTWNPITGCTPISPGCDNCYARRMAHQRLKGRFGYPEEDPFRVTFHADKLDQPLRWRKRRRVFVCSMGDLFHKDVQFEWIARIWDTIFDCMITRPGHRFLVLTKRPERILEYKDWLGRVQGRRFDYENVWLGVTAENQEMADLRIPILLQIPAAVRFVSIEPMLGPVDFGIGDYSEHGWLKGWHCEAEHDPRCDGSCSIGCPVPVQVENAKLDWVIVGGETGPGARPMHPEWVRSVRDQCQAAGVPFFFKSWGAGRPEAHDEPNCQAVGLIPNGRNRILDGRTHDDLGGE